MSRWIKVICLLLASVISSYGRETLSYNFEHLTTDDGLGNDSIGVVVQDSTGMIWIGTRYGLDSYDGSHVRIYESRIGDENTLIENQIKGMEVDAMTLYIQTFNYLTIYDIAKERFTNINIPNITSIDLDKQRGVLWVVTINSIKSFDLKSHKISDLTVDVDGFSAITSVLVSGDNIYLGTEDGLFKYNLSDDAVSEAIPSVNVINIFKDRNDRLWVSTGSNGAYMIEKSGEMTNFTAPSISHNFVRRVCQDHNGEIWLGTYKGLDLLDVELHTSTKFVSERANKSRLSQSSIWSLFCDRDGVLWAGTYFSGLNILDTNANKFRYYVVGDSSERGVNDNIVGYMIEDEQGNIYIGTHGGGAYCLDPKSGEMESFYSKRRKDPYSLGCNSIQDIYEHSSREILFATNTDGLNIYDTETKRFRTLQSTLPSAGVMTGAAVCDIEPYRGEYLLSTLSGVYICNLDGRALTPLVESDGRNILNVRTTLCKVDCKGRVWIGTETDGLYRYEPDKHQLRRYKFDPKSHKSLLSNEITCVFEDRHKRIWVSTPSGLSLYQPETDAFESFTKQDGLPSSNVYEVANSLCEDLLVTTDRGVALFSVADREFKSFTADSGLPLSRVTHRSLLYADSGRVYVGGNNGFMSFVEQDQFRRVKPRVAVNITALRIGGEFVSASDSTSIVDRNVMLSDEVNLNYNQNSVTIDFTDMVMTNHYHSQMEYKLDGFDDDFVKVSGNNSVTYTNLPYKRYKFTVRSIGEVDGVAEDSLIINVRPPLYLSRVALFLYLVLFVAVVCVMIHLYHLRRVAVLNLDVEQQNHQRDREYDQAKLKFFANISHELRTPLSLISGQLEYIMGDLSLSAAISRRAAQAFGSVKKLQSLVDELLDLRKQQNGYAVLMLKCESVRPIVEEVFENYRELASYRGIDYRLSVESEDTLYVMCDRVEIEKVFFNLLSNAFKFTKKGFIEVVLSCDEDRVVVAVKDSGIGIERENQEKIFDRFFQEERAEVDEHFSAGAGIGLSLVRYIVEEHKGEISVESSVGDGSIFIVSLPRVDASQVDEEETVDLSFKAIKESILLESGSSVDDILNSLNERANSTIDDRLILIVEDNAQLRAFLVDLFSKYYKVESASDGEDGYRKTQELQPSLVLSDVVMPNLSGIKMCEMIRGNDHTSHIPVVLLTERTSVEESIEGYSVGADDYIAKPFSVKLLLARVENILQSRKSLMEQYSKESSVTLRQLFTPDAVDEEFLSKAFNIVVENISNEEYTVDQFASDMFMGRTTFFKRLKSAVDMTPNEFILTIRLKRAVEMLKSPSNHLIADIADKCGFNSQQYFCSCFKRKFGVSPAQYAKEGRE